MYFRFVTAQISSAIYVIVKRIFSESFEITLALVNYGKCSLHLICETSKFSIYKQDRSETFNGFTALQVPQQKCFPLFYSV